MFTFPFTHSFIQFLGKLGELWGALSFLYESFLYSVRRLNWDFSCSFFCSIVFFGERGCQIGGGNE